jgi:hypothetical protein
MGFTYLEILDGSAWVCATPDCGTHLALDEHVLSRSFRGATGTAYLFGSCVNLEYGKVENRELLTGTHRVCEVHCRECNALVGWKYIEVLHLHFSRRARRLTPLFSLSPILNLPKCFERTLLCIEVFLFYPPL